MPRHSPTGFFGPSRCVVPTPGLTSEYSTCSVCVCVCVCIHTHIHPRTLPSPSKNRSDPDNTHIVPSVKNFPIRQATNALHRLAEPLHPRPPTLMNKLSIHERMCIPCREYVRKYVRWCLQHLCYANTCKCTGAQHTCLVPHLPQQMQIHPRMHTYAIVQQLRCHGNYCKICWVLCKHRAGCCLLHAHLLSRRSVTRWLPAQENNPNPR